MAELETFSIQCPACGADIAITGRMELEREPSTDRYASATIYADSSELTEHAATHG